MENSTSNTEVPVMEKQSEDPLSLEGLPAGDPLRALQEMPEYCACCPALRQCVDTRVARNVANARTDLESRVFPVLRRQAIPGKRKSLTTFVRTSLRPDALDFVRENVSTVACMADDQRTMVKRVMETVARERAKPAPSASPELSVEEFLKIVPPENALQKTARWLSFKFAGDKRQFAKLRRQ